MTDAYVFACAGGILGLAGMGIGWAWSRIPRWLADRAEIRRVEAFRSRFSNGDLVTRNGAIIGFACINGDEAFIVTAGNILQRGDNGGSVTLRRIPPPGTVQNPADPSPRPRARA
jgi:hypothetical protein